MKANFTEKLIRELKPDETVARKMVLTGTRLSFNFFEPVLLSKRRIDLI